MVAEQIKKDKDLKDTSIMMLTSMDIKGGFARCRELVINTYLVKPIQQEELFKAIAKNLKKIPLNNNVKGHIVAASNDENIGHFKYRAKVLLAEDNLINQRLAVTLLEKKDIG